MSVYISKKAGQLNFTHLGRRIQFVRAGELVAGVLTYLGLDLLGDPDEKVLVSLGQVDSPVENVGHWLPAGFYVLIDYEDEDPE